MTNPLFPGPQAGTAIAMAWWEGLDGAISAKTLTYDFHRQMDGAAKTPPPALHGGRKTPPLAAANKD